METFKDIINEAKSENFILSIKSKKSLIKYKKEIEYWLYNNIKLIDRLPSGAVVDIMSKDIKPNMFNLQISSQKIGTDNSRTGLKRGRKVKNATDVIELRYYDSFWKHDRSLDFFKVKELKDFMTSIL